jgi:hypothetical protein
MDIKRSEVVYLHQDVIRTNLCMRKFLTSRKMLLSGKTTQGRFKAKKIELIYSMNREWRDLYLWLSGIASPRVQ